MEIEKVKLYLIKSTRKHRVYGFKVENLEETFERLKKACAKAVLPPTWVEDCGPIFSICNPSYGNISIPVSFEVSPEKKEVIVTLRKGNGLLWLETVFKEIELPFEFETPEERRLKQIRQSLTEVDYKILEMRGNGLSLWAIASSLGVTIGKVRHTLQKLSLIPEYAEKLGAYKPLPWNERFNSKRKT